MGDTVALEVATAALDLAAAAKLGTTVVWAGRGAMAVEGTTEDTVAAERAAMEGLEVLEVVLEPEELEATVMVSDPGVITVATRAGDCRAVPGATL